MFIKIISTWFCIIFINNTPAVNIENTTSSYGRLINCYMDFTHRNSSLKDGRIRADKFSFSEINRRLRMSFINLKTIMGNSFTLYSVGNDTPDKVLLIDATGLAYRCFFALPEIKTFRGSDIGCLMGFMNTLTRLYKLYSPKYIGLVFDSPGSNDTKREVWPAYKLNRQVVTTSFKNQISWIRELCSILGLPAFIKKATEADDIITSIINFLRGDSIDEHSDFNKSKDSFMKTIDFEKNTTRGIFDKFEQTNRMNYTSPTQIKNEPIATSPEEPIDYRRKLNDVGYEVTVVTSDKDLMQILSNNGRNGVHVRIVQPHKAYRIVTEEHVRNEYGVDPERFSEYLALVGDHSDNIPGIMGIGPKTAPKLIEKYKTFDEIINSEEINKLSAKGDKYEESIKMAHDFHSIVRLRKNVHVLDTTDQLLKSNTLTSQFNAFLRLFSLSRTSYKWDAITK